MDTDEETSLDYDPKAIAKENELKHLKQEAYWAIRAIQDYPDYVSDVLINALNREEVAMVVTDLNEFLRK